MLRGSDLAFTVVSVLAACAFVASAVLQSGFLSFLETQRPDLWKKLGQRKPITEEGNFSYAAAQWYLITGEYSYTEDETVIRLAFRARVAFFATLALLFAVLGVGVLTGRW